MFFYVLFVCKCVLPPCDNPIAVNKHISYIKTGQKGLKRGRDGFAAQVVEVKPIFTHCGRVTQICVFNTVKLGTSASSP